MNEITSAKITCNSCEVSYLSCGRQEKPAVVLLHGMKFQAATWQELGTLDEIAGAGFRPLAVDMPGFGRSPACSSDQDSVLLSFCEQLGAGQVVLVGPSMGGRIALEFAIAHPALVSALVLVGPVGVEENREFLGAINVPTLLVWGSEDVISPLSNCDLLSSAIPGARKIILEGAPHPCYLDNPGKWHAELVSFLASLKA